jgi:hypothetical protein
MIRLVETRFGLARVPFAAFAEPKGNPFIVD